MRILLTIFGLSLAAVMTGAQQTTAPAQSMSLCGQSLELGLTPKVVFEKFNGTECTVYKVDGNSDMFAIGQKGKTKPIGTVEFVHGNLGRITREWATDVTSPEELGKITVNALQEMKKSEETACVLKTYNHAEPSSEDKIAELKCGQKHLVFMSIDKNGQKTFQIEEILG